MDIRLIRPSRAYIISPGWLCKICFKNQKCLAKYLSKLVGFRGFSIKTSLSMNF
jgi:hypothetical protein